MTEFEKRMPRIGNIYHHYKPYDRWQGIMSIIKDKHFFSTESEARAWVEDQFINFIKQVTE